MEVDTDFTSRERQSRILKALQLRAREVRIQVRFVKYDRDAPSAVGAPIRASQSPVGEDEKLSHDQVLRREIKAWGHRAALTYELVIQPGEWGEKSRIRFVYYAPTGRVLYETPFHDTPEQVFKRDFFEEEEAFYAPIDDVRKFGYVESFGDRTKLARPIKDFIEAFVEGRIGELEIERVDGFPVVGVFINDQIFGHAHRTPPAPFCATPDFIHTSRRDQQHVDVDDGLVQVFVAPSACFVHMERRRRCGTSRYYGALHMMALVWIFAHDILTRTPEHTTLNNVWRVLHDLFARYTLEPSTVRDDSVDAVEQLEAEFVDLVVYMRRPTSLPRRVFEEDASGDHHEPTHSCVYRGFPIHPLNTLPALDVGMGEYIMKKEGSVVISAKRSFRFDVFASDNRKYVLECSSNTLPYTRRGSGRRILPSGWKGTERLRAVEFFDASDREHTRRMISENDAWFKNRGFESVYNSNSFSRRTRLSTFWLMVNVVGERDELLTEESNFRESRNQEYAVQRHLNPIDRAFTRTLGPDDVPLSAVVRMLSNVRYEQLQRLEQKPYLRVMELPGHNPSELRMFAWLAPPLDTVYTGWDRMMP